MGKNINHIELAKALMREIQYDNGMVDRWHPESYPEYWVTKIAEAGAKFFDANPEKLTEDDIFEIACGFHEDNEKIYGPLIGWTELNDVLNDYFDNHDMTE